MTTYSNDLRQRQELEVRTCMCGCGDMVMPNRDFQVFLDMSHRNKYWGLVRDRTMRLVREMGGLEALEQLVAERQSR